MKAEIANYETIVKDLKQKLKDSQELFAKEKEVMVAEMERKDAIFSQLENEKHLMQIQIDQLEESNEHNKILYQECSERADRLELEKQSLVEQLKVARE